MATKQPEKKVEVKVTEGTVAKAPEKSFDERTDNSTPPWQRKDGSQDNGDVVVSEPTIEKPQK